MDWYKLTLEETVKELETDPEKGLTSAEAKTRLERYGRNELIERGRISPWRILFNQFKELMVIILIIAAIVSLALGETIDTIVIVAIVILNAAIGFSQEYRAEQAMAALKRMAVPTVRVRRDGQVQEVSSTALVPGDIVLLEAGNVVPADGRLVSGANLKVEEAALTGESEPVEKRLRVPKGKDLAIGDRDNMVYMGTSVTYGRGSVAIVETGMETELGRIAELIQGVEEEQTPLQRRLDRLGKTLAAVAIGIIALVVVTGLLRHGDLETLFLTGISMAVAAVPEGLPAVVTITLALGSQRLLKRHALIRKLPAVETLGSVTVICSDKTGTLTENRMTVTILDVAGNRSHIDTLVDSTEGLLRSELIAEEDPELTALSALVRIGALCNDASLKHEDDGFISAIGDPTEGALLLAAHRLGYDKVDLDHRWPRVGEVPFTSERKRMTTIHQMDESVRSTDLPWGNSPFVALSKGAVDSLIDVTDSVLVDNEIVPLTQELHERILQSNAELAGQGQRVLGIAFRFWDSAEIPEDQSILEQNEVFAGMVAMMDPPRPEAEAAVQTALQAGIRPIMITGDHPLTALRIAQELGITDDDHCITGPELAKMSVEDLQPLVDEVEVYARVAPEHKLNIVQALQNNGQVAAMTGDGVNDAPALKQAEIGIAMGITGTDVAKEAADMVLLDDNFATIVAAVEEGRVIFDNIRKFILYTLSSNAGELWVMLIGPFLGMPLPLRPLQILWVNLVTDGLPGLALAQEQGEAGVMKRSPFKPTESVFSRGIGTKILWIGFIMGLVSLAVGYFAWAVEGRPPEDKAMPWQTMVFTTLVLAQMGNALAIRSGRESLLTIGVFSNRLMVFAVLTTFVLQMALIYVPFMQTIFRTVPLSAAELAICLASSSVVFFSVEIYKWFYRRLNPLSTD
ncbi:MAG: cation-translocating P-type ATPase [Chloroflexota bacterium]|jgi:Ca2+-transporting ATPase